MARTRRKAPTSEQPVSLVASATRLPGTPTPGSMSGKGGQQWQEELWRFYDSIGEFRYAADWIAAVVCRAVLFAVQYGPNGRPQKVESGPAAEIVRALFGGPEGHSDLLKQAAVHLTVAGEFYLVAYEDGETGEEEWFVVASGEMKKGEGRWKIGSTRLPEDVLVIRVWDPHPRKHGQANSPGRAVLPILREIEALTKHVAAQIDSRLTSAGILFVPKEITFPAPPSTAGDGEQPVDANVADAFTEMLTQHMQTAIRDQDSAAARVPIVATVPAEYVDKAHHLTFWSDLDEQAIALREEAIGRLALGMNVPKEVLTGTGETNHWSAWQIDESAIKVHAEPMLRLITTSLSKGYLRPALRGEAGFTGDVLEYGVGADSSEMRLRPNRSQEAIELYDRGELDGETLRRETGFHDDNAPEDDEQKSWVLMQIIKGNTSAPPNVVVWALREMGYDVPDAEDGEPRGGRDDPSLEDHPTRDVPERESALLAACNVLVYRALERAGNRMRSHKAVTKEAAPAAEAYLVASKEMSADMLLEDAWSCVASTTAGLHEDPEALTRALDSYTRVLLSERRPHDRRLLAQYLSLLEV